LQVVAVEAETQQVVAVLVVLEQDQHFLLQVELHTQ
jgi:hypothetical protein